MFKIIMLLSSAMALSACTAVVDSADQLAGIGVIKQTQSDFDGAQIISVSPNHLFNANAGLMGVQSMLGARWSSVAPDLVAIQLTHNGMGDRYPIYTGLSINVDGAINHYDAKLSTVYIPITVFESMLTAQSCMLRIEQLRNYETASCSSRRITGGKATAINSFDQMLVKIKAYKK
jgi:hypothetical protein